MKKVLIMILSFGLVAGVSAQRHGIVGGGFRGGGYSYSPRVVIGGGFYSPFYPYYGYYNPYYLGYPGYANNGRPSKLTMKVEDIKSDYADRIYSVRQDKSLTGKDRRQQVRELKKERDQAIDDLESNYHKRS
jgi:hypothetical protein